MRRNWLIIAVVVGCIAVGAALYLTADKQPRAIAKEAAEVQCRNNLRLIALALKNYHADHGSLPPAYIADADGTPLHSWRVLLLPFLVDESEHELYAEYRFDEPWNGPNNGRLVARIPHVFRCSKETYYSMPPKTSCFAVVGDKTFWPGSEPAAMRSTIDDRAKILLVEVGDSGIDWTEPKDLEFDQMTFQINAKSGRGIRSSHPRGAYVAFADGRVELLTRRSESDIKRMLLVTP